MTLYIGVLFWVIILVIVALWVMNRPAPPYPWPNVLLFVCIVLLGIATFGSLHLAK